MVLVKIAQWCCEFFYKACPLSLQQAYLKSVYKTVCLFQTIICGNYSTTETNTSAICQTTHYLDYFYKNFTNISCNITLTPELRNSGQSNHSKCNILDFFKVLAEPNPTTSLEMLPLPTEDRCFLHWCVIPDHAKFWWRELCRKWYKLVGVPQIPNLPFPPELKDLSIGNKNWIKELIYKYVELVDTKSMAALILAVGGTTIVLLLSVKYLLFKLKKDDDNSELINFNKADGKKLIQMMETFVNNSKKTNEQFKDNILNSTEAEIKKLNQIMETFINNSKTTSEEFQENILNSVEGIGKKIDIVKEESLSNIRKALHDVVQIKDECTKLKLQVNSFSTELFNIKKMLEIVPVIQNKVNELENMPKENLETNNAEELQAPLAEQFQYDDPYVIEALKKVEDIYKDSQKLEAQVENFSGSKENKTFLHLKEMLIRNTLKLDNIESEGHSVIRKERKSAIKFIHNCLKNLEDRVTQ